MGFVSLEVLFIILSGICFYVLRGMYIVNVGKTASMSMLTLFELRSTLKGRYNIGNVGKTASLSMLTLFESIYIVVKVQHW